MMFENDTPGQYTTDRRNRLSNPVVYHGMGKLPPQAIDLEEAVIGALLLEKDAVLDLPDQITAEIFYEERHKKIFKVILTLVDESTPVDILTVTQYLRKKGELEMIGGAYYITELTNRVASAANVSYHSMIIYQKFLQREIIRLSTSAINEAYEDTTDVLNLLETYEERLYSLSSGTYKKQAEPIANLIEESNKEMAKPAPNGLTGIPSGYTELDRLTGGWQKSDLVIIAARPAMGKTAFVLNCARNAAVDFNKPVVFFSLEMSAMQLTQRLQSSESCIELEKIRKKRLEEWEMLAIFDKSQRLSHAPLIIDDTPSLSIFEFRAKCRRLKAKHDIQLIIIDYLQLMTCIRENGKGFNREQEIGMISRALKTVAKELDVPVIALAQLSRAVETRTGSQKKPVLSDLRESGSIEQDADMVIFPYRPEYYGIEHDENNESTHGMMEIILAKHRNGELDNIRLQFIGKYMQVNDWKSNIEPAFLEKPASGFIIRPSFRFDEKADEPPF